MCGSLLQKLSPAAAIGGKKVGIGALSPAALAVSMLTKKKKPQQSAAAAGGSPAASFMGVAPKSTLGGA
jgi:hypothetical protein